MLCRLILLSAYVLFISDINQTLSFNNYTGVSFPLIFGFFAYYSSIYLCLWYLYAVPAHLSYLFFSDPDAAPFLLLTEERVFSF